MLPGDFDWKVHIFGSLSVLIAAFFVLVTGVAFYANLIDISTKENLTILQYVLRHSWATLTGPGSQFVGFLITFITAAVTLLSAIGANRREAQLRKSFAAGIWKAYSGNFLQKVSDSMKDKGILNPIVVLASPSYDVAENINFGQFVGAHLSTSLGRSGYKLDSLLGDNNPNWFRQIYSVRAVGGSGLDSPPAVFFDYPSTFLSFYGAIDKLEAVRGEHISEPRKKEFFHTVRADFFTDAEEWARREGVTLLGIPLETKHVDEFATRLISVIESHSTS